MVKIWYFITCGNSKIGVNIHVNRNQKQSWRSILRKGALLLQGKQKRAIQIMFKTQKVMYLYWYTRHLRMLFLFLLPFIQNLKNLYLTRKKLYNNHHNNNRAKENEHEFFIPFYIGTNWLIWGHTNENRTGT